MMLVISRTIADLERAFSLGVEDRYHGKTINDCPFLNEQSIEAQAWTEGWLTMGQSPID